MPENGTNEHVAKAESVIKFISEITEAIGIFSSQLAVADAFGMGVSKMPGVNAAASRLQNTVKEIAGSYVKEISPIKSIITKTI